MSWKETCYMNERVKFIAEYIEAEESIAGLCRLYDISRKTAYKWIERYEVEGPSGLHDRCRAPKSHPNALAPEVEEAIVDLRGEKMTRGPLKILALLAQREPHLAQPCASTVAEILRRRGLSAPRRKRRHASPSAQPFASALGPNDVWCADFKGWFRVGDGRRCDPLTISDAYSRYLLRCQAMSGPTGYEAVRPLFEAAFREYGLPLAIHTDNGSPFASTGLAGLSRLSVWWIRLGIRPERSRPGKPQDNGRHERMHRTLKAEAITPPARSVRTQQQAFERFRREYNEQRPHQALGQRPPADFYASSPKPFPARLEAVEYRDEWPTRSVRGAGQIKWQGRDIAVSQALAGQRIGLEPAGDGLWRIHFRQYPLGLLDERRQRIVALPRAERHAENTGDAR